MHSNAGALERWHQSAPWQLPHPPLRGTFSRRAKDSAIPSPSGRGAEGRVRGFWRPLLNTEEFPHKNLFPAPKNPLPFKPLVANMLIF